MTNFKNLYLGLLAILLIIGGTVNGQINTPAGATNPFASNLSYGFGIMPTNLPTGGAYGKSQDAADAYNEWKAFYVDQTCAGGTQARVKFDDLSKTVSEGIAYGMLLSVYAADKTLFDKLWAYYKANSNGNNIMNWKINGCSGTEGFNGATDAEFDAAMALIIAEAQWPAINTPYDYSAEASNLITKTRINEMEASSFQAINGDGWGFGNTCRNPSYQSPAYYKAYATQNAGESTFWNNAITGAYNLINANAHVTTGLVSDWSNNAGVRNTCNGGFDGYGYDACRNPWRMGVDAIWWDNTNAKTICNKLATYISSQGVGNVRGPRYQDGTGGGNHNATFVSMYASALVGSAASNQSLLNSMYTETKNVKDVLQAGYPSGYFGNTLRCISLFVMTGNFWKPGTQASQEINVRVGAIDVPNNSTYDFQNVQNASTKSIVFTIENKGSVTLNISGSPRVNVTSGTAFTVSAQPGTPTLAGGATTTFTILFTPASNGLKTGTISIANNDTDENPYVINLIGTGTTAATNSEISVTQNGTNINTGTTFNFGNVTYNSTSATTAYFTFTITNTGDAPLNLTPAPTVSGTGGYALELAPVGPVATSGTTTFIVKLTPTSTGTKTGSISIPTNDPDENPFIINFTANAVLCNASITATNVIQDYDANNNLTLNYVNANYTTIVNPFVVGNNTSYTTLRYNHPASSSYDGVQYKLGCAGGTLPTTNILISMLVYSPQAGVPVVMNLKDPSGLVNPYPSISSVTVNTTKVNQWERLYFRHTAAAGNANVQFMEIFVDPTSLMGALGMATYYIDNIRFDTDPCIADLPASGIFNDYDDHRNVTMVYGPSAPNSLNEVYANPSVGGLNTSATVARFTRGATGTYSTVRYSACNGGVFDLSAGKTVISMLVYSPYAGADFLISLKNASNVEQAGVTAKTTLVNTWERLYFDVSGIQGNITTRFMDIFPDPLLAKGAGIYYFDDIKYDVNPCYVGISATGIMQDYNSNRFLNMANANAGFNDLFANPSASGINTSSYVGRLVRPGTGVYNLIRYQPCGTSFDLSPGKTIYAMDVYSPVANLPITMLLKQANGTTTLVADSSVVVAANTWTTVTFDFSSALSSDLGAFLDIYIDPNITKGAQTYYIDNLRFAPAAPEINVRQNVTTILTGGTFDMGTINIGSSSAETSFTIQNNGTGTLTLSGSPIVAISGTNFGDFIINQTTTIASVGPVSSTTFTVTFTPSGSGVRTAILSIANNDAGENPYIINLTGTGQCAVVNAAGTITGLTAICSGAVGVSYSIDPVSGATGYTWTIPTGASITAGLNTTNITVTFGSASGNVTVTPINSCASGTAATKVITVSSAAGAAGVMGGFSSVCSSQTGVAYSITPVAGATSYLWTLPSGASIATGTNTNSITVNFGSTAGDIVVTPVHTCGNGATTTKTITIAPPASAAGAITGLITVCSGQAGVSYSIDPVAGATGYTWTVPTGASIATGSGTNSITVNFGSSSGSVGVTPTSACGNGTANSIAITLSGSANPAGAITGLSTVCSGQTGVSYLTTTVSGATGYTWTLPAGASIASGSGTSITVNFGSTSGNVTVTPTSSCGNGASTSNAITVNGPAGAAGVISGPLSACNGATGLVYSITAVSGASGYTWTVPSGSTITSGAGTTSIQMTFGGVAGNVSVTPNATCGDGTISNLAVTLFTGACTPPTSKTVSGPTSVVSGTTVTYSVTPPAVGSTYTWSVPPGSTIVSTNGDGSEITVLIGTTSGNVVLTETNAAGSTNNSLPIAVSPATGVNTGYGMDTYDIYPTPFDDATTIRINSAVESTLKIKVADSKGTIVYTSSDYSTNENIMLGKNFGAGIYYVEVSYQNKVQVLKLVKL